MGTAGHDPTASEVGLAARLAAIVESSHDAILSKTLDGVITSWNPGAARMYGYRPEEIIGQNVTILIPPDWRAELGPIFDRLRRGERVQPFQTKRRRKDGTILDASVCISPLRDQRGAVTGASVVARDMTERNQAEAKRQALEQELRRSERLETLGHLAGGIAHDFNNLLARDHELRRLHLPGELCPAPGPGRRASRSRRSPAGVPGLARQLLIFSRQEPAELTVVDLNSLLSDIQELRTSLGSHIELRIGLADQPAVVLADRGQHPADAAQPGRQRPGRDARRRHVAGHGTGTPTLATATPAPHPGVTPGRHVQLSVRDTGHGMSPEVAARIFEPFFTTKQGGAGAGLGLSTVYGIVTQAGGSITVDSAEGEGATFRVYLPAAGQPAAAPQPKAPEVIPAGGLKQRETILIVDDEPSVLAVTSRILRQHGYPTLEAGTGGEALHLATTRDFQLLLTDSVMPGMNGPTLAERVATLRPGVPIIRMSGSDDTSRPRPHRPPGTEQAYIQKPFTASALIRKVRAALANASIAAGPPAPGPPGT